jgi:hypothetical protein
MGIKEGKEVQEKGVYNIFNTIIAENSPNFMTEMPIQVQETDRTPSRHDQKRISPQHIIDKTTSAENKEIILKSLKEKSQITCKSKPTKITDFSTEILKVGRAWSEIF